MELKCNAAGFEILFFLIFFYICTLYNTSLNEGIFFMLHALHWILSKEPEVEALPVPAVEDLLVCQVQAEELLTLLL